MLTAIVLCYVQPFLVKTNDQIYGAKRSIAFGFLQFSSTKKYF